MDATHLVTCFLRNRGAVLLRRSDGAGSAGSYRDGITVSLADDAGRERDPETAARAEIARETGLAEAVTLVRAGDSLAVEDEDRGTRQVVHPFLFDCDDRAVDAEEGAAEYEWVSPTELLRRETAPGLWDRYDRVRPTVETVADDRTHGAAYISVRALEVLRDEAALAAEHDGGGTDGTGWDSVAATARDLLAARPAMPVVANRVNRAMAAAADERTADAVDAAARDAVEAALSADAEAAAEAATLVSGARVVTCSRSGTVARTLARADPDTVLVAESRPGGEGVGTAERLAEAGHDVTLAPDAALAHELGDGDYDAVLVGADTVLPDGAVVNKVGTRALALAAAREDVPVYAVAARDKVSTDSDPHLERADPTDVYAGDADLTVSAPLFDVTPADLVTAVVTEDGPLDADAVAAVAAAHRERADWE